MDGAEDIARALTSAFPCSACQKEFPQEALRDFEGVPVCVECYRDFGLLTLHTLEANLDEDLVGKLLSCAPSELPPGPRRRFEAVERVASRVEADEAEKLILTTARGQVGAGMQEVLWVLLAADAVLRSGGLNGKRKLEGRELSLLLNLAARVGIDVGWAAMKDAGVAERTLREGGEEWAYEDKLAPGGTDPSKLAAEKAAFSAYVAGLKGKVDLLAGDLRGRRDGVDVPLALIARVADEVVASIKMMEQGYGASGRPAPP